MNGRDNHSLPAGFLVVGVPVWVLLLLCATYTFEGVSHVMLYRQKVESDREYAVKVNEIIKENSVLRAAIEKQGGWK